MSNDIDDVSLQLALRLTLEDATALRSTQSGGGRVAIDALIKDIETSIAHAADRRLARIIANAPTLDNKILADLAVVDERERRDRELAFQVSRGLVALAPSPPSPKARAAPLQNLFPRMAPPPA